jgi:hypothetical protein
VPAGWERCRPTGRVGFELVAGLAGQLQAIEVGEGYAEEFGLAAAVGAHSGVTVSGGRGFRIRGQASIGEASGAIEAEPAGNVERRVYAISAPPRSMSSIALPTVCGTPRASVRCDRLHRGRPGRIKELRAKNKSRVKALRPGGVDQHAKKGEFLFPLGALWNKGITIGQGQAPVKKYNVYLRDLILAGKAKPSFVVSHRLPLSRAVEAYAHFDQRGVGAGKNCGSFEAGCRCRLNQGKNEIEKAKP